MHTVAAASTRTVSLHEFAATLPGKIVLGLAATAVVAAAAHVSIPLPFTPVPLTLQPLAVLGVGLAFGPVGGFLTMLAYLAEGLCGLPVFAPAGPGGILQLLGPTGGFLMAYPLVAAIVGGLTPRLSARLPIRSARFVAALFGGTVAIALLFLSGAAWFFHLTDASLHTVWIDTVAPYLPGEVVKVFAAAGIYSTLHRTSRIQSERA
jgi:biotin transport system substrate-specific component